MTTDQNHHFIITQPGSYYLSGNLEATKAAGAIRISSQGVTLDLNGFVVAHAAENNNANGIRIDSAVQGAAVRNGTIKGFSRRGRV